MFVPEESINDKDVAAAPHRVSRLLKLSRSHVTTVLLHYKQTRHGHICTHLTSAQVMSLKEYGDRTTQAANVDRRSWALARDVEGMETRYRRMRRCEGEYTLCYDRIMQHRAFRQQRPQRVSVGRTKHTSPLPCPRRGKRGPHPDRCPLT